MASPKFERANMKYRFLGDTGLRVSEISLGSWITFGGQVADKERALACFREARKQGINFFDSAEGYHAGAAETLLGTVFKELEWPRSDLVVCTKIYWGGDGPNDVGLSRKHILEGTQKCLDRLQLDYVDVIMAHRCDPAVPMEEIVRAFSDLVTHQHKALYWGTSEWSAAEIEAACQTAARLGLVKPVCDQPQYNLLTRQRVEQEYRDAQLYRNYRYGLTVWSPLASGVLSGKYNDLQVPADSRLAIADDQFMRAFKAKLTTAAGRAEIEKVKAAGAVARELGCTTAQLALAWCLTNPHVSTVITGASRPEQITENVQAVQVAEKLTPVILARLDEIMGSKPPGQDFFGRDV
ncbi:Aldo/keto reductase [Niveomyces insectorum RCEF 264]|uniref:Aldo/keto reductase n=1 Tax=Niveomyces insectorum RCEF 264 TaxID=1081102 RepID=A0A167MN86_9HYPO|nr:Aldo/keto reductase [Niveomyces insectorum RCEF 264]